MMRTEARRPDGEKRPLWGEVHCGGAPGCRRHARARGATAWVHAGWFAALIFAFAAAPALADPVAEFYSGRSVALLIGFGPGGGYDSYARVLGRHLGKHIPG